MLTLYRNGVDLVESPPAPVTAQLATSQGTPYTVDLRVIEDDTSLGARYVSAFIDWNDGSTNDTFSYLLSSNGTLAINATRLLSPGEHNVNVTTQNYRAPAPDVITVNFKVTVTETAQGDDQIRYLYGPILPKDTGYPNAEQWNFNSDKDTAVLASSVKMLVETQIGERIMLPTYGTDLRALLFDPEITGIETLIQERITQALTLWEPRVNIVSVVVNKNTNRSVTVYLQLVSKLDQQEFQVSTTIQQ